MARRHRFLTRYLGVIERGQRQGEIRRDLPAAALSRTVLTLIETLGTPTFAERSGLAMVDLVRMIRSIILSGLTARALEENACDAPPPRRPRRR